MELLEELRRFPSTREINLRARENLFARREGIYLILEGAAELYLFEEGRRNTLDILLPGDAIGFLANSNLLRRYRARTLSSVSALHIPMESMEELGRSNPSLLLELFSLILSKQAYLYRVMTTLSMRRASQKIRGYLHLLEERAERGGLSLTVTRRQLASITGLSYEHTVRELGGLRPKEIRRLRLW